MQDISITFLNLEVIQTLYTGLFNSHQPENKFSVLHLKVRLNGLDILAKKFISWCIGFSLVLQRNNKQYEFVNYFEVKLHIFLELIVYSIDQQF